MFAWKWGLQPDTPLGEDEVSAANIGSSIFFMTLVVGQMGHIMSIRRKMPYCYDSLAGVHREATWNAFKTLDFACLWRNIQENGAQFPWHILYAWCGSIATIFFFTSIPAISDACSTGVVPGRFWGLAIGWSVLWFVVGEIRKWIIVLFPDSFIAKTAW
jgi:hypothetical protein